jgi:hypothetical protein
VTLGKMLEAVARFFFGAHYHAKGALMAKDMEKERVAVVGWDGITRISRRAWLVCFACDQHVMTSLPWPEHFSPGGCAKCGGPQALLSWKERA